VTDPAALEAVFVARVVAAGKAAPEAASLGQELARLVAEARATWPTVPLGDEDFVAHLADRWATRRDEALPLDGLRTSDLFLACAAARGVRQAIELVDERFIRKLDGYLHRLAGDPGLADDVRQSLRQILLVAGEEGPPKLATYAGRGDLLGFVKVTAARLAVRAKQRANREGPSASEALEARFEEVDVEAERIRALYRPLFKAALARALDDLPARDRLLLEQHYADDLGIDELGRLHGVHRATAARWLQGIRDDVRARVRRTLMAEVRMTGAACDSLMGFLAEDLRMTLGLSAKPAAQTR
jgi:RNA polymerase sigma-70 factor (ECF subfamily)